MERKTWDEFGDTGLIWLVNTILHAFGWCICRVQDKGKTIEVYPARTKFRGFSKESNDAGYRKVTEYMNNNATELLEEIQNNE